jgi:hypothetical protein
MIISFSAKILFPFYFSVFVKLYDPVVAFTEVAALFGGSSASG